MGGGGGGSWNSLGDIRSLEQKAKEALQPGRKNVFISFSHDDLDEVNLLRAQARNEKSDIEFNDRSVHVPYDSQRAEYIRSKLADRINQASTTVVYISSNTEDSKWVRWEVEKSIELGKRVIAMHKGESPPENLPDWLTQNKIRIVTWAKLAEEL